MTNERSCGVIIFPNDTKLCLGLSLKDYCNAPKFVLLLTLSISKYRELGTFVLKMSRRLITSDSLEF